MNFYSLIIGIPSKMRCYILTSFLIHFVFSVLPYLCFFIALVKSCHSSPMDNAYKKSFGVERSPTFVEGIHP